MTYVRDTKDNGGPGHENDDSRQVSQMSLPAPRCTPTLLRDGAQRYKLEPRPAFGITETRVSGGRSGRQRPPGHPKLESGYGRSPIRRRRRLLHHRV
jgi:hypothetical protein